MTEVIVLYEFNARLIKSTHSDHASECAQVVPSLRKLYQACASLLRRISVVYNA